MKDQRYGPVPHKGSPFGTRELNITEAAERRVQDKTQFVFPVLMGGVITFILTAIVTFTNVGVPTDFMMRWIKSWSVAWPIAAVIAYFSRSRIGHATDWVVVLLDRVV